MTDQFTIHDVAEVLRSASFRIGITHCFDDMVLMPPHMRCVFAAKMFSEVKDEAVLSALERMGVMTLLKKETMLRLKNGDKIMRAVP